MSNKTIYLIIALLVVGFALWFGISRRKEIDPLTILSFQACVKAGYPVVGNSPRQCLTPDGRTYAEELSEKITYINSTDNNIKVELPFPGAVVGKEITIIGTARGPWYFEASFPIEVKDNKSNTIATGVAQAQGEWMTANFVPFKATLKVPDSYIGPATIILKKDNPSGLPQNDASISFPITIEY